MSKKSMKKEQLENLIVSTFASILLANRETEGELIELGLHVCAALSSGLDLSYAEIDALRDRAEGMARFAHETIQEQNGATLQ